MSLSRAESRIIPIRCALMPKNGRVCALCEPEGP